MPPGRTSMPGLQATDLLATRLACSGRRHNQRCRLSHECKLGDQTRDDADKEPREERSCGRSQTSLHNDIRTHRSLDKDAPVSRLVQRTGSINSPAILGGLHHHYVRVLFSVHTGVHATLLGSCLAACARAPGGPEGAFRARVNVQPAIQLPACSHVGVSGSSQVPRQSILCLCLGLRPRPNRRFLAY
jgi:hypothetical protein